MEVIGVYFRVGRLILMGILLTYTMGYLLTIKKSKWARLGMFIGCMIISGMVIFIGDWVNIVGAILVYMVATWIVCDGSKLKKTTIGLMMASTILAANGLWDNFFEMIWWDSLRFLFVSVLYIGIKKFAPPKDYELGSSLWCLLLLLTLTPLGIVLSVILLTKVSYYIYIPNASMYFTLLLIAVLSFVGLLWAVIVLAKQQKLEGEQMLSQINQKYYETMEAQYFEIRRLKHDLANHLQALSIMPEEDKKDYISTLLKSTLELQPLKYCKDPTVNAVLAIKENLIKQYDIKWTKRIEIHEQLPFEQVDICALFANTLDNAIEACRTLKVEERRIHLESCMEKGLFVLSVKNPSNLKVQSGQLPSTSKAYPKEHGIGLRSIKEIVERNQGGLEICGEDGAFEVFLYLPIVK